MKIRTLMILSALVFSAASLGAQSKPDARVAKQLRAAGLQYETTDSGNYSIKMDIEGGRSQTVYIRSSTEKYDALEIREIWSNAGDIDPDLQTNEYLELLKDSNTEKIGAWCLEENDDGTHLAYFAIMVPVYIKDKDLGSLVEFAGKVTDAMESSLFDGADDN